MDIYRFFNSEAICNYIMERQASGQYRAFTPTEKAWLIFQCHDATIKEKHQAWNEIIETESDCSFVTDEHEGKKHHGSLHDFLRKYMLTENELIDGFLNANTGHERVYHFMSYHRDYYGSYPEECPAVFRDFENGKKFLKNDMEENCISISCNSLDIDPRWLEIEDETGAAWNTYAPDNCRVVMTPDFELLKIDSYDPAYSWRDETFYRMDVNFPVPFKKGDVLCIPDKNSGSVWGPFINDVLHDNRISWLNWLDGAPEEYADLEDLLRKKAAFTGHYDRIDALVNNVSNLMDCEYYDAEKYYIEKSQCFIRWHD